MVIIFTEKKAQSVSEVALWLNYYHLRYLRINTEEINVEQFVEKLEVTDGSIKVHFNYKGNRFSSSDITSVWIWHAVITHQIPPKIKDINNDTIRSKIIYHLKEEYNSIIKSIFGVLSDKKNIGNYYAQQLNKIDCLHVASLMGLSCPDTLLTTNKSELKSFSQKHGKIITKGIQEVLMVTVDGSFNNNYTEIMTREHIEKLPDSFAPSLFQKYIEKKYELRIFYLSDVFYPAAIFSQNNEKTKVDFRKYDLETPNRIVPFKLPINIEHKLKRLLNHFSLSSASIDIVVDINNDYKFLEINPVGQYSFISDDCNYYLHKKIAQYLT